MNEPLYQIHLAQLNSNLQLALGCTEPIAIAYAAAIARDTLCVAPTKMIVECSGNIIKNVQGVIVPNSGGLRGVAVAAILGLVGGDANRQLEVLQPIDKTHIAQTKRLLSSEFCTCMLAKDVENLYIRIILEGDENHSAEVIMRNYHTNITYIRLDDNVILNTENTPMQDKSDDIVKTNASPLSIESIFQFADEVKMDDVGELIERQIQCNCALSKEGLDNVWGAQVARSLLATRENSLIYRARAAAAAGSDARMNGCTLPAVINSGSGNQGLTVTMPVITYAKELNISHETLIRALVVANLISIHQKKYVGSLSAYCGAISAAVGAACGIAYMSGDSQQVACDTIINTVATIGGMVCDGAKSSCAAKISIAVETALSSLELARLGHVFQAGEGIVKETAELTIQSVGRMAKDGMHSTDVEILNIMLGN